MNFGEPAGKSDWPVLVRPMAREDVEEVHAIEETSFSTPWSAGAFLYELKQPTTCCVVLASRPDMRFRDAPPMPAGEEIILGYGILWLLMDEAHVSTLAVRPEWRGRGLGELLLLHLLERAVREEASEVTLEVRTSNQPAIGLYRKYGLETVGLRPHYYPDNREDAWIMTVKGIQASAYRNLLARRRDALRRRLWSQVVAQGEPAGPRASC